MQFTYRIGKKRRKINFYRLPVLLTFSLSICLECGKNPSSEVDWNQMVWHPKAVPKTSCCLYIGVHDRLQTRDRLFNFGMMWNLTICYAKNKLKVEIISSSSTHIQLLFRNLSNGNSSWHKVTLWTYDEIAYLQESKFSKTASRLMQITLGRTVWSLWQEGLQGYLNQNHAISYNLRRKLSCGQIIGLLCTTLKPENQEDKEIYGNQDITARRIKQGSLRFGDPGGAKWHPLTSN